MTQPDAPPQNLRAEEDVLGAMLLSRDAIAAVVDEVRPEDFYRETNGAIFKAVLEMDAEGLPVDVVTLADYLDKRQNGSGSLLEHVGGKARLAEIATSVPPVSSAGQYARIVREMATLRGLIRAGGEIAQLGWERPGETRELVEKAEQALFDVTQQTTTGEPEHIAETLREQWRFLQEEGGPVTGIPSGFPTLDKITTGFQPGNLILVAARPSMGKTALGLNISANNALAGRPVLLFSLEMTRKEIGQRLMASEARVTSDRIRTRTLEADDWAKLTPACQRLANSPLIVDDTAWQTIGSVRSKARRVKMRQSDLGLVVVDYLGLLHVERERGESQAVALGKVSRGLKVLAMELEVPVIALAQLNRDTEHRGDKRPALADLRDSGRLEEDADVALFLYRDDYYDPKENPGIAEVIVAKHRNGPTGTAKLAFVKRFSRFDSLGGAA